MRKSILLLTLGLGITLALGCANPRVYSSGDHFDPKAVAQATSECDTRNLLLRPLLALAPSLSCEPELVQAYTVTGEELAQRLAGCSTLPSAGDREWCEAEARKQP